MAPRLEGRPAVSVPLPLPVRFGLLPSLLPTQTLAPVLYSIIVSPTERLDEAGYTSAPDRA